MKAVAMLAVCAALVAMAVGCAGPTPISVAPTPFPSPSDNSSPPRPSPSDASLPWVVVVPFPDDPAGRGIELTIDDPAGVVAEARAATGLELARVFYGDGRIGVADLSTDPPAIVVGWVGTVCDLTATLTVMDDGSSLIVEGGLAPGCDLVPLARGVVLELASVRLASSVSTALLTGEPIEAIARSQAEQLALGYWGPQATVADVAFAPAADLDPRLQPPDRIVWAITVESGELPGSCPSLAPGSDPFAAPPCRALGRATIFLDAVSGAYLGYVPA